MSKNFVKVGTDTLKNVLKEVSEQSITDIIISGYPWSKELKELCQTPTTKRFYNCLYSKKSAKELMSEEEIRYMLGLNPNILSIILNRNFILVDGNGVHKTDYNVSDFVRYAVKQGFEYTDKVASLIVGNYDYLNSSDIVKLITTSYKFYKILQAKELKFSTDEWRTMFNLGNKKPIRSMYGIYCEVDPIVQKEIFIRLCEDFWKIKSDIDFYVLMFNLTETFKRFSNEIPLVENFRLYHRYDQCDCDTWSEFLRKQVLDPKVDFTAEDAVACGAKLQESDKILLSL